MPAGIVGALAETGVVTVVGFAAVAAAGFAAATGRAQVVGFVVAGAAGTGAVVTVGETTGAGT